MIYLDNAATTLVKPPAVGRAVSRALRLAGGPGRSGHQASLWASEALYDCREAAAGLFKMRDPERVVLTSNCTHALNLAIVGLAKPGMRVVTSGLEHNAVMRPLHLLTQKKGVHVTALPTTLFEPEVAVHLFEEALRDDVGLVVCTHVSNAFGYVLPVERIAQLAAARGVPMIIDAAQSAGCLPIHGDSGPYWCMPGHKGLLGPQGTGLLLVPPGGALDPLLAGGTGSRSDETDMPGFLPDRLEPGTQNVHGVAGLSEGIKFIRANKGIDAWEKELLTRAAEGLAAIRGVRVFSAPHLFCQSGALSFVCKDMNSETVAGSLAKEEVCVRGGLHCAPSAHKTADTFPGGTVRLSVSATSKHSEIRGFLEAMRRISRA